MNNVKLSVIIVSWNVKEDLLACLKSLYTSGTSCRFEVIIVDNASADGSAEASRNGFPQVELITNSENRGFAAAVNQAIKIAKGEYILLLNPDTLVHRYSLDALARVLDEEPTVGACGPKILDVDGQIAKSIGYVPTFRSLLYGKTILRSLGIFRQHYRKLNADIFDYSKQGDAEQISGAAIMVRRSVLDRIGGMDETFFMYYEDVDLCLRIRKGGWRITYVSQAVITHTGGRSTVQVSAKKKMMLYRSLFIYLRKHKGRAATVLFGLVFKPGVLIRNTANVPSGAVMYIVSTLRSDKQRQVKSLAKIKGAMIFLIKYSLQFVFKV